MSFPLRERGLKQKFYCDLQIWVASFPLRERGLKPYRETLSSPFAAVVPLAGTWIETSVWTVPIWISGVVVPLAGTWIETTEVEFTPISDRVVPLAGTWIETERK